MAAGSATLTLGIIILSASEGSMLSATKYAADPSSIRAVRRRPMPAPLGGVPGSSLQRRTRRGSSIPIGFTDPAPRIYPLPRHELEQRLENRTEPGMIVSFGVSFASYQLTQSFLEKTEWVLAGMEKGKWIARYALFFLAFSLFRSMLQACLEEYLERRKELQNHQVADMDSLFALVNGLQVHYKREKHAAGPQSREAVFIHGFGANTDSWEKILSWAPYRLDCAATALDLPGWGLTQRPLSLKAYELENSAGLVNGLVDSFPDVTDNTKTVLVGHSLGAISAVVAAHQRPERVAGVVLVAPAVGAKEAKKPKSSRMRFASHPVVRTAKVLKDNVKTVLTAYLAAIGTLLMDVLDILLRPFLVVILRRIVRERAFWERGLGKAYYDESKLTNSTIFKYRRPGLVRGWDYGVFRFLRSRVAPNHFPGVFWRALKTMGSTVSSPKIEDESAETLDMLKEISERYQIPVKIIHGEEDSLVPFGNSERIVEKIPNIELVKFPKCGHVPHEECPEKFLDALENFKADLKY